MADDPIDGVTQADPPAADPAPTAQLPEDRPAQNIMGDFNRKYGKIEQKVDAILQYLATQSPPQAQAPSATRGDSPTRKQEVWMRAQQGDQGAFEEVQQLTADERIAA